MKLIDSQKKNKRYRSKDIKYNIATCEKRELKKIIEFAFESYSKYSTKKKNKVLEQKSIC